MYNYPSQDQPGRSARDDGYGRTSRDFDREQEYGNAQRRNRPSPDLQGGRGNEGLYSSSPYNERDSYEHSPASQNFGAHRGNRAQPWPRNEDRENYSAAPEYGRPDQYFENGTSSSPNRFYAWREYGQSYGGPNANYRQGQNQPSWRDNRGQQQAFGDYQNRGYQNDYASAAQYGVGQRGGLDQPGFFQTGDFSQQGGYTRSEYPEDSYLRNGQHPSRGYGGDNLQAGRTMTTENWQEREGAQRGAFGLQNTHRGRGPQGYTRSDDRIKEDICERLSEHHYIDASQIQVEVSQGVVTLEGSVDDRWQKYQTEDLVDATSGVKDIQNRLNVSRASRQAAQWTSQPAAPQSTSTSQQTASSTQGANARKTTEKSEQGERGKPGFTSN